MLTKHWGLACEYNLTLQIAVKWVTSFFIHTEYVFLVIIHHARIYCKLAIKSDKR